MYFQEPSYGRLPPPQPHPSLDELHRRRKEIMAQLEERKVISPPPFAPSPTLPPAFHQEEVSTYLELPVFLFNSCVSACPVKLIFYLFPRLQRNLFFFLKDYFIL